MQEDEGEIPENHIEAIFNATISDSVYKTATL